MPVAIIYAPEFKRDYKKLSDVLRIAVKERSALFQENPFHPLLRTHKLTGALSGVWSYSIDFRIRILFEFIGNQGNNAA